MLANPGERDRRHGQHRLVDQRLRALHAPGRRDRGRRGAGVPPEQSAQMSRGHPEGVREVRATRVRRRETRRDQPEGARHRLGHARTSPAFPAPTPADSAGTHGTRALGRGRGGKKTTSLRLGGLHRADGPAIDPRRAHAGVERAVEARVSRQRARSQIFGSSTAPFRTSRSVARQQSRGERGRGRSRPKTARQPSAEPIAS